MAAGEPSVFTHSVPNRSTAFISISIVFLIVTTGFFAFRQGWRWAHRQRGLDDAMAACAYIILVIQTVFGGVAAHYGFGKHIAVIKPTYTDAMFYFYLYQICYKLLGGFTKLTFCFLYLRIFNQKGFHRLVIAVAAIVAAGSVAFALVTVFQCLPVHHTWNRKTPGTCINNTAFWYSHAAFNTFWDIVIYLMPIPLIRNLKLQRGQKTGLVSIFALGAFVIAASIVRMVMLRSSAGSSDPTWGSMIALTWTEIEGNTSVIVCCLPALRVPFLDLWHRVKGGTRSPTPNTLDGGARRRSDGAWTGPNRSSAIVTHQVEKPERTYHSNNVRASMNGSGSKNANSHSSISRNGDTWYDKVLSSVNGDQPYDASRSSSSQDELARAEAAIPPKLEPGAIYKTTDVHVSTDTRHKSEPDAYRQVSLQEMLNHDR
ncbi:hypothetical protein LTR36_001764 [Oleoguttula mirabilis]|uniref:Rhodopsin domain-containing protein n=1 Tax=Oleoguttula mirabilis TaxID=1507867 RepID=A0AAV9JMM1_9PEZI|nr:hypothetical protein LTR36_001764 [Oleoguttula mirabilis]